MRHAPDLRLAPRRLRSAPGFAATAIVTLALAIGANAAIFALADAVLFRPLPYAEPDRLFVLTMLNQQTGARSMLVPFDVLQTIL